MSRQPCAQPEGLQRLISFHGHLCPGLLIGYRATLLALRRLKVKAAADEELVAIVENNSCSVDAVQFLASCTFGKGNLYYLPFGKQAFTFARRPSGKAIRVSFRKEAADDLPAEEAARREELVHRLFSAPDRALFRTQMLSLDLPPPAQVFPSLPCEACGEPVMETAARLAHGHILCQPCFEAETSRSRYDED